MTKYFYVQRNGNSIDRGQLRLFSILLLLVLGLSPSCSKGGYVVPAQHETETTYQKVYDVQSLTYAIQDFPAAEPGLSSNEVEGNQLAGC